MGEIKSTLDLIMEKTRGLSMTPEEREAFRREEWAKKARGWLLKFLDGLEDLEKVRAELLVRESPPAGWEKVLKKEIVGGLDPEKDNEKHLRLLKELLNLSAEPFRQTIEDFRQRMKKEAARREALERERLKTLGVSGSAVLPNLSRDAAWRRHYQQARQACLTALASL